MNGIGLVICVLFGPLLPKVNASEPVSYEGFRVYDVIVDEQNDPHLGHIGHGVSLLSENHVCIKERIYSVRSYLVPRRREMVFRRALDAADAVYDMTIPDLGKLIEEETKALVSRRSASGGFHSKIYLSYDEMVEYLIHIGKIKNPQNGECLAVIENIGNTYEGRDMFGVKISSEHRQQKPIVFFEAGIHAREWTAPAAALYTIQQLVENYTSNTRVLRDVDFYIIPLSNPDGYEYSRTKDRLWRKTRSTHTPGYYGVDGNRNFNFHWGETGSSSNPSSNVYRGPIAFSEPESRNIRDAGKKYENRLKAFVSIHAYGPYVLYPWGYSKKVEAPDTPLLKEVASKAAEVMKNFGGSKYIFGPSSVLLYEASGATDDYFKGVFNVPLVYTVELSSRGAHSFIVAPERVYEIAAEAYEGFKVIAQCAVDGQKD